MLDGTRPDTLLATSSPALKSLAFDGGAFSFHVNCDGLPLSAPAWTTILTGVPQDQHHVTTNNLDFLSLDSTGIVNVRPVPECACGMARKPLCAIFKRGQVSRAMSELEPEPLPSTVFARLAARGRRSALLSVGSWEGVMQLSGMAPGASEGSAHGGLLTARHLECELEDERAATKAAVSAVEALLRTEESDCPDLVAMYLHYVDGNGHTHGFGYEIPEYRSAIEFIDGQVGRLLDCLERRTGAGGIAEDWLVVVTTDHGGTSQHRMPPSMRRAFKECGCVQLGIPQTSLPGVHGLRDAEQHTQTFQIVGAVPKASQVDAGELLPAPRPRDIVPTLLEHLGVPCGDLCGTSRGLLAEVPPMPAAVGDGCQGPPLKRLRTVD